MKKIIIFVLIILFAIILAVLTTPFIKMALDSQNPFRKSEDEIYKSVLEFTPIGMSMENVIQVIEGNKNWETAYINYEHGVSQGELGRPGDSIGEKSIRVTLGKYVGTYRSGNIFTTFIYTNFDVYVEGWWGFDENGKLIEIFVKKDIVGF